MGKNIVIAILAVCMFALAWRVAQLENYHYASSVGFCTEFNADDPLQSQKAHICLHDAKTRTNPLWHIYYALIGES